MMVSVSGGLPCVMSEQGALQLNADLGRGLVCVHDLNSLLVAPGEEIRFKTTKIVEGRLLSFFWENLFPMT